MKDEEKIEEIKNQVFRHPNATDLYMKRVPNDIAEKFKEIANKEFVGDYGLCLRECVNSFEELKKFKSLFFSEKIKIIKANK